LREDQGAPLKLPSTSVSPLRKWSSRAGEGSQARNRNDPDDARTVSINLGWDRRALASTEAIVERVDRVSRPNRLLKNDFSDPAAKR